MKNAFLTVISRRWFTCIRQWFLSTTNVCLLCSSLYCLKKASCASYTRFTLVAKRISFIQRNSDPSLFFLGRGSTMAYLLIYVDAISLTASTAELLDRIISNLSKDLGKLHHLLKIFFNLLIVLQVSFFCQWNYAVEILYCAMVTNYNPCLPVAAKSKISADDSPLVADPFLC